jgi:hypothetical protein
MDGDDGNRVGIVAARGAISIPNKPNVRDGVSSSSPAVPPPSIAPHGHNGDAGALEGRYIDSLVIVHRFFGCKVTTAHCATLAACSSQMCQSLEPVSCVLSSSPRHGGALDTVPCTESLENRYGPSGR